MSDQYSYKESSDRWDQSYCDNTKPWRDGCLEASQPANCGDWSGWRYFFENFQPAMDFDLDGVSGKDTTYTVGFNASSWNSKDAWLFLSGDRITMVNF